MLFNDVPSDRVPRVESVQTNIIFNIPHPSLLLHIHEKTSRNAILLLIQEVKRDIIFRRMNLPPSVQRITDPRRLAAHLNSTICRLRSYLQYIGLVKYMKAADLLLRLQEFNLAWRDPLIATMLNFSCFPWHKTTYPIPTLSHVHTSHTQHSKQFIHSTMKAMYTCTHPPPSNLFVHSHWYNVNIIDLVHVLVQCILLTEWEFFGHYLTVLLM